jgi:hypothetical protein
VICNTITGQKFLHESILQPNRKSSRNGQTKDSLWSLSWMRNMPQLGNRSWRLSGWPVKKIPTQHSTSKSCASFATRTSGGNISLIILVIVAAWHGPQHSSLNQNPKITTWLKWVFATTFENYYNSYSSHLQQRGLIGSIPLGRETSSLGRLPALSISSNWVSRKSERDKKTTAIFSHVHNSDIHHLSNCTIAHHVWLLTM